MSELPNPIGEALREGGSELGAQRVWGRLSKTLERRPRRRPVRALLAVAAVFLAIVATWAGWPREVLEPGPLTVAGEPLCERHLLALQQVPTAIALADGSVLRSVQPARLELLENSAHVFSVFLHSGEVQFEVQPGGPRRWTIETGLVTVEVVGTKFNVARSGGGVRVSVERGVVLVRGERVPNRVRRLEHGQTFELTTEDPPPSPAPLPAVSPVAPAPVRRAPPRSPKPPEVVVQTEEPAPLDAGEFDPAREKTPEELFTLADVARVAGHDTEAISLLERIIAAYPDDPMAPVAAFTIGKLQLEQLRDFAAASESFERADTLGIPDALREQTFVRWVEALGRAGQRTRCREVAQQYRQLFPGARSAAAEQQCAP